MEAIAPNREMASFTCTTSITITSFRVAYIAATVAAAPICYGQGTRKNKLKTGPSCGFSIPSVPFGKILFAQTSEDLLAFCAT